jgi:hypothetical protein
MERCGHARDCWGARLDQLARLANSAMRAAGVTLGKTANLGDHGGQEASAESFGTSSTTGLTAQRVLCSCGGCFCNLLWTRHPLFHEPSVSVVL